MEQGLAREAEAALFETMRRMTPEQRLETFLEHSRRVMELYHAGQQQRAMTRQMIPLL